MLIFQFIVLFSNFEYYASHPIFDKTSMLFFLKENVFLPNDSGGLFDWDYDFYKSVIERAKNAFTNLRSYNEFINLQIFGALRLKIIWEQSKYGILLAKLPVSDELFELKLKTQKLKRKAKKKLREERKKELALWKEISNKKILGFKFKIEYDENVKDFNLIEEKVEIPENVEDKTQTEKELFEDLSTDI